MTNIRIEPFLTQDKTGLWQLLQNADLPVDDITAAMLNDFLVAHMDAALAGTVGIERYGETALLRSLAVCETCRGIGLGKQLVAAMEARARKLSIGRLYLLTTTADRFFAAQGYQPVERDAAPEVIRTTAQFSRLCPVSSSFMVKAL
jgi:amino-acid N-acetyltransferase